MEALRPTATGRHEATELRAICHSNRCTANRSIDWRRPRKEPSSTTGSVQRPVLIVADTEALRRERRRSASNSRRQVDSRRLLLACISL